MKKKVRKKKNVVRIVQRHIALDDVIQVESATDAVTRSLPQAEQNRQRLMGDIETLTDTKIRSTFLFATPSVVEGFARTFDIAGQFDDYNSSPSSEAADAIALGQDWRATGDDMRAAIRKTPAPAT